MNLGHLLIFHAVAQAGNLSRGAERLMISQPAASKQIAQLERSPAAAGGPSTAATRALSGGQILTRRATAGAARNVAPHDFR